MRAIKNVNAVFRKTETMSIAFSKWNFAGPVWKSLLTNKSMGSLVGLEQLELFGFAVSKEGQEGTNLFQNTR